MTRHDPLVALSGDVAVAKRIGMSVATLWRKVRAGKFPAPIRIGRRTLWRSDEITAWINRETSGYRSGRRTAPAVSDDR